MGISSDELFHKIDNAPVGVLIFSGTFEVLFLNESFRKISDYYNFRFPEKNLNKDLQDFEVIREELNYLPLGYSFEKEVKSLVTPGIGKVSLILKGTPSFEGETFSGGIITAADIRFSENEDISYGFSVEDVLKNSSDYTFIIDRQGKIRFSTGRKYKSDILYQNIFETISGEYRHEFTDLFHETEAKRYPRELAVATVFSDDLNDCRIFPLINNEGKADYFLVTFNQASELLKENIQLRQSIQNSEKFRSAADSADEMIYIYDRDLQLIYSNRKAEFLPNVAEYFNKKDLLAKLYNHPKYSGIFEAAGRSYNAVFLNSGEDLITCYTRDITSERLELRRIKDSEEILRNIFSSVESAILNISPDGTILYSNRYFRENFDPVNSDFVTIIEKSAREHFYIPDEKNSFIQLPVICHGVPKQFLFSFNPVTSDDGEIISISVSGTDVSRLAESLSEISLYHEMFKGTSDGIVILKSGKIFQGNSSFSRLFGYEDVESLRGKNITDFCSPPEKSRFMDQLRDCELSGSSAKFEFPGVHSDGTEFYISASISPIQSSSGSYIILICRDVNERRKVQQAIRKSEEKFRTLTENIDDFLYTYEIINNRLKPTFYTVSVEKITGYTQADFLRDYRLMFKIIYPDDLAQVKKKLKTFLRSRLQISEELEFRIVNRNGNVVWVRNKINITRGKDDSIQKVFGLVSDISFRKKAEDELKRSTDNLIKLNDAKDKFISIISHDLRTPFSSILGFTDLLLTDDELSEEEKKQYVHYIQDSSKSMLALVNSLLDWTRLQTGRIRFEPEKFFASSVVDEVIQALSGSAFQKKIEIISEVKEDAIVYADKGLLFQALSNLVSNAIKFTRSEGQIVISTKPSDKIRFMQFTVKDNGVGIPPENLPNLFRVETKFTSEGTAGEKGSGLGLSLVKEIVEKHGGTIWVESTPGRGSEFKFTMPVTPSNILLVDDSNTDRLLYSKLLRNFAPDYNIESAANGKEALENILNSPPALIITDHVMPEMNGYELVLQLKKSKLREVPPIVILSSGLSREIITAYNDAGIQNIFQKPVNLVEFKQTIEKLLRKTFLQNHSTSS